MRTKTLLLIAAVGAAGAATSMAQVFSVNAVGYVNKTIPKNSFLLVSNPLTAATNTINALFSPVPAGFAVYIYTPGKGYDIGTYDDLEGAFLPASVGTAELKPGQGVFVRNPTSSDVTITFVGEVPQGNLSNPMVAGLQIVSSMVPQAGTPSDLGFPSHTAQGASPGDQIYKYTPGTGYTVSTFDDLSDAYLPAPASLDVGEAIFVKLQKANSWNRNFSVNQ
jgi:hypothetical protein